MVVVLSAGDGGDLFRSPAVALACACTDAASYSISPRVHPFRMPIFRALCRGSSTRACVYQLKRYFLSAPPGRRLLDCSGPGSVFATKFALSRKALGPPDDDDDGEDEENEGAVGDSRGGDGGRTAEGTRDGSGERRRAEDERKRREREAASAAAAEREGERAEAEEKERYDREKKEQSGGGFGDLWQGRPKPGARKQGEGDEVEWWGRGRKL